MKESLQDQLKKVQSEIKLNQPIPEKLKKKAQSKAEPKSNFANVLEEPKKTTMAEPKKVDNWVKKADEQKAKEEPKKVQETQVIEVKADGTNKIIKVIIIGAAVATLFYIATKNKK